MKNYIKFNPVRSIAALSGLAKALIALAALQFGWTPEMIVAVGGVETAAFLLLGTLFIENRTSSNAALDVLVQAAQQAQVLSPAAVEMLSDVAECPCG